jgi:hypothetical protein
MVPPLPVDPPVPAPLRPAKPSLPPVAALCPPVPPETAGSSSVRTHVATPTSGNPNAKPTVKAKAIAGFRAMPKFYSPTPLLSRILNG